MNNKKYLRVFKKSQREDNSEGGSYTKFIFPFTYIRQSLSDKPEGSYFKSIDMNSSSWVHRKRYLTEETANVLYERAKWYELSSKAEVDDYQLETGIYPIKIMPPKLIMFERKKIKPEESLLCLGFLVVEARILAAEHEGYTTDVPVLEDLLKFNELYRYWRIPFEGKKADVEELYPPSLKSKKCIEDNENTGYELFLNKWLCLLQRPIQDNNGYTWNIASKETLKCSVDWWENENNNKVLDHEHPGIFAYKDDRCFVWTCALIEKGEEGLGERHTDDEYHANWVKLLNVDLPVNDVQRATPFELAWVKERTYTRWRHYGCLYGFNHHSGAMLSDLVSEPPTWQHFSEQYFDMLMLMLYLKVTLFKFSRKLSEISAKALDDDNIAGKKTKESFSILRAEFAVFTNLYQFPLISNHQQAIEMYLLMRKHLDVDDFFKEVEAEIKSTHEMIELQYSSKLTSKADKIASVGIPFAIGAFFVALFSVPGQRILDTAELFNNFQFKIESLLSGKVSIVLPVEAIWVICIAILAISWLRYRSK